MLEMGAAAGQQGAGELGPVSVGCACLVGTVLCNCSEFVHRCSTSGMVTCPLTVTGGPVTFEAVVGDPQCQPPVVQVLLKNRQRHTAGAGSSFPASLGPCYEHAHVHGYIKKDRKNNFLKG